MRLVSRFGETSVAVRQQVSGNRFPNTASMPAGSTVELPMNRIAAAPQDVAGGISSAVTSEFEPRAEAAVPAGSGELFRHLNGCCRIVGGDCLTRRTMMGKPSDTNCISYVLPFLSVALQEMLETCLAAKFPICLHSPADNTGTGTGRPSTFGLSLEFSSIRSMGSSYRLSSVLDPFSPENEMMWLSSVGSSRAIVNSARPRMLWKYATDLQAKSRPAILEGAARPGHQREYVGVRFFPFGFVGDRNCGQGGQVIRHDFGGSWKRLFGKSLGKRGRRRGRLGIPGPLQHVATMRWLDGG